MSQESFSLVQQVIGVATKKDGSEIRGQGRKGPWVMYSVILENGVKLNVFGPVKVGDTVYDLEQNEEYHSWQGKVKAAGTSQYPSKPQSNVPDMSQPSNATIMETFIKLRSYLDERFEKLENAIAELKLDEQTKTFVEVQGQQPAEELDEEPPKADKAGRGSNRDYVLDEGEYTDDILNDDIDNKPIDLSEIPF